jgi:hypothetical protein
MKTDVRDLGLERDVIYQTDFFIKGPRELVRFVPIDPTVVGGVIFRGCAKQAMTAMDPSTGQTVQFDLEFNIDGADSIEQAFEMYDDAKNKAVKEAQKNLNAPKPATGLVDPMGVPIGGGPKL